MSKVANTYWVDSRLDAQRVTARALPSFAPVRDISREIIGSPAEVRRRGGLIPAWVFFGIIFFATLAVCFTVNMRSHSELSSSSEQYQRINAEIETLRRTNASIGLEIRKLREDPRTIEAAARTRLNMVRPNEIVVPIE
ncbi:MAG: Septum formation initiator [Blastocatellia bacterium]|nr:Septum formation initiator [Blastocatellia bacterium]